RDEDRDAVRDTPAALRRGRVEGRAGCDRDRAAESRPYDVGRRDALVQPRESLWQRGQLVGVLACRELGIRALDGFAERRGLPAHEREVAVDPLQLVPRRARALGGALRDACGLGDFLARAQQVGRDAASFALALGPFFREARGGRRKLLVSPEERSLVVAEATLVALPHEMRALRLDTGGTCLCQSYPRSRGFLLGSARAVGGFARAARGVGGLVVDTGAALAEARELCRQRREGRAAPLAFRTDRGEARLEPRDALARRCLGRRRIRRRDATKLLLLSRGAEILVGSRGGRLALGRVIGQALDLFVHAADLRGEIGALVGRRAERRLVPAQRPAAELVSDRLVLIPFAGLVAERFDARADLAKDVVHANELGLGELHSLERFFATKLQSPGS